MTNSNNAAKSRLRILVVVAGVVTLAVLAFFVWAFSQHKSASSGAIDWAAAGVAATALAGVISMWTGLSAVYAAQMALVVDQRAAERAQDARTRDTQLLALVFQHELQSLREQGESFSASCEAAATLKWARPNFTPFYDAVSLPTLTQHIGELGVFDKSVRTALAAGMKVVMTWRSLVNPAREPRDNFPTSQYATEIGKIATAMKAGLVTIHTAERALDPYTKA